MLRRSEVRSTCVRHLLACLVQLLVTRTCKAVYRAHLIPVALAALFDIKYFAHDTSKKQASILGPASISCCVLSPLCYSSPPFGPHRANVQV